MTAALNLGLLGNNVNTSGQVSLTAGVSGTLPVANGGTGITSAGTSGNVLISNGSAWTSAAAPYAGARAQIFTAGGTFTVPTGVTAVKVTVVGGGGGSHSSAFNGSSGGGGAVATKFLTGLTPAGTLTVTVGALGATSSAGGTSSIASGTSNTITTVSASGGGAGVFSGTAAPGAGGTATNGDINISGVRGVNFVNPAAGIQMYFYMGYAPGQSSPGAMTTIQSGCCILVTSVAGTGFGAASFKANGVVQAGTAGAVIFEW